MAVNAGEDLTWNGPHRERPLQNATIFPRPEQPLKIWLGTGGSPQSVYRAVELGLPMFLGILGGTPEHWARYGHAYREAWAQAGHPAEIGEMSDAAAIDSAVAGADAVVSALGPSMDRKATGLPLVAGTGHIIDAMKRHGVRRYIGHATPAVLDPREKPTPVTRLIAFMPRTFMRRAYEEITGMSGPVTGSGLEWTIVRFIAPKNTPKQPKVRAGFFGTDKLGFTVSRADIAAFTAAQVDEVTYIGRAPAISN